MFDHMGRQNHIGGFQSVRRTQKPHNRGGSDVARGVAALAARNVTATHASANAALPAPMSITLDPPVRSLLRADKNPR